MIDIESLGTRPGSVVTQIGWATFGRGEIPVAGSFRFSVDEQLAAGAVMDIDTLRWWSKQAGFADQLAAYRLPSMEESLRHVAGELKGAQYYWANSPNFDMVLLEDTFRRFDVQVPWKYSQLRDMRTALMMRGYSRAGDVMPPDRNRQHDAEYDALYQAQVMTRVLWK
jgi:hypothetical protein